MPVRLHLLGIFKKFQPSDPWEVQPGDQSVELLLKEAGMDSHAARRRATGHREFRS